MDFQAADGTAMSQVEADVERETLYNAYSEERITCEKRLKRQEAALEGHRAWYVHLLHTINSEFKKRLVFYVGEEIWAFNSLKVKLIKILKLQPGLFVFMAQKMPRKWYSSKCFFLF